MTAVIVVMLLAALGTYTGGYFYRGVFLAGDGVRVFPNRWEAIIFIPAGSVESLMRGKKIVVIDEHIRNDFGY